MGESAEANIINIKEIVNYALAWELRSNIIFEGEKIVLVYFIRNSKLQSKTPMNIKEIEVLLKDKAKILNIIMDSGLRFKNHIKKAASKKLRAVLALKYMRALIFSATRQLFNIIVISVINYISSV